MKTWLTGLLIAGLAGLSLALPLSARADDEEDGDHDRARELYEHGEIRSLYDVLRKVQAQTPGDVVAIELLPQGKSWVYRIQVVAPDGRRSTIDVDAGAATILRDSEEDE